MLYYFLLASMVFVEKYTVIQTVFLLELRYHFSLATFKICGLLLVFRSLVIMGLGMDFFRIILSWIFSSSWIHVFCQVWEVFIYRIFKYILSFTPFLLSWDSNDTHVISFVIISQMALIFFVCFSLLFSFGGFYCLSSSSLILSSVSSIFLLSTLAEF